MVVLAVLVEGGEEQERRYNVAVDIMPPGEERRWWSLMGGMGKGSKMWVKYG